MTLVQRITYFSDNVADAKGHAAQKLTATVRDNGLKIRKEKKNLYQKY